MLCTQETGRRCHGGLRGRQESSRDSPPESSREAPETEPAWETRQPPLLLITHMQCNAQELLWAGFTHQPVKIIRKDFAHSEKVQK